jgi:hypothetical protein
MNGSSAYTAEVQAEMIPFDDCPCCYLKDRRVRIALHLTQIHNWDVQKAMDWLRDQEEKETSRA